jgi:hypothetical protein
MRPKTNSGDCPLCPRHRRAPHRSADGVFQWSGMGAAGSRHPSRAVAWVAATLALWFGAPASATLSTAEDDYGAAAAGCDVTEATPVYGPNAAAPSWQIQSQGLAMPFGERSTLAVPPRGEDQAPGTYPARWRRGEIAAKIPWFRERRARGMLWVKATSQPGGHEAHAHYTNHLGPRAPVIPGTMSFPHEGCWRVVGKAGDNTLRATVWVVALRERPD